MAVLRIKINDNEYKDYPLNQKTTSIGRDASNDIVIENPSVSNRHARLNVESSFFLTDLRSSNGTFINGKKILHTKLSDGDTVHFAGVDASFHI